MGLKRKLDRVERRVEVVGGRQGKARVEVTVNLGDDGFCSRWGELSGTESELAGGKLWLGSCGRRSGRVSYSGL